MGSIKVESVKYHTTNGQEYPVGATYAVDESAIDNLVVQGMVVRVSEDAPKAAKDKGASTKVEPMTTDEGGSKPLLVAKTRHAAKTKPVAKKVTAGAKK